MTRKDKVESIVKDIKYSTCMTHPNKIPSNF